MKKKFLALVLTLAMVLSLLPATALATGGNEEGTPSAGSTTGSTIYVDATNGDDDQADVGTAADKAYKTLEKAVTAAVSGDTIRLSEGKYSTYGNASPKKSLTFVGAESGKTEWYIGSPTPDQQLEGTEYNGDYSFDGCENITFQKIKFNVYPSTYKGFIRIDNVVLDECEINGFSTYWGYQTTTFRKTVFNCSSDYALWYYTGHEMTFDGCTFNSKGKMVNAYREGTAETPLVLNFKDCTVNSTAHNKQVLNIKDSTHNYIVNISGNNTVTGVEPNTTTCSRWFQVQSIGKGKSHYATVNIDGTPVWAKGEMLTHKYSAGEQDNAFTITPLGEWTNNGDGTESREVTKTCNYCGYKTKDQEIRKIAPIDWDVSKSKTATKLDTSTWTSNVTLSLPSAQEKLASDIVFVLDKSSCSKETAASAAKMLTDLQSQVQSSDSKIRIGVVVFGGDAKVSYPLKAFPATEDALKELNTALSTRPGLMGGSNMHAGLLAAQEMLKSSTTDNNRKYVILVSDGLTRLFTGSDGKTKDIYYQYSYLDQTGDKQIGTEDGQISPKDCVYFGMIDEWTSVRTKETETALRPIPYSSWSTYFSKVKDWVRTDGDTYALDYETYGNDPTTKVKNTGTGEITDPAFKYISHNDYENHAMSVDRAVYEAYNSFTGMVDSGYHCYAVLPGSGTPFGTAFMGAMNEYANNNNIDFTSIGNEILYAVSADSTVTDTIGEKFDFADIKSLTVGGKPLTMVKDGENVWYFGNDETASAADCRFKVECDSAKDKFVWTINENVSNFAPVQLTYTVKLTKHETDPGTYGTEDLKGENLNIPAEKALFTNERAVLNAKNSAGAPVKEQEFPKPSVSYTVKGGGGGSHKPTVTIPDDVPTGLNGKDHYAYVVGYPDGMVYPQKNITRAEVATIFFRLLEDETREANMTKSNSYNDMKEGAWYTCAVSTLSKMGIIKGYEDGSFKPDASISRAEFAAIAARFDPDGDKTPATFSDVSSHWAKDEISIAANHGWIKGYEDGSFKPDQKITRAETMTLVNRVLKRLPETKDDLHKDMKTWPDNQNESAWFYLAVQEATNSHYQKLKKDGIHETWESMRETRDWAALEK